MLRDAAKAILIAWAVWIVVTVWISFADDVLCYPGDQRVLGFWECIRRIRH
jgi:hypothetical protein